ncbi:putative cullin C-terminus domain -containing protein [Eastern grey kangaroopox virus]|uniref:Putative cullin C-terminus domain-containing protein n=1 Tax=Eastern grey kangaroopox virus TaxID=2042482 RepID=A0A2C9DT01_9POXV|nr:putative cullin C-terminus domain -containing protein [Eastern grey kangaroopox virus]ATI21134.1 putative cullin C-terminus domain -containing protein [Eastern grey kangaroopox virus]ATX75034.1 putative cullin C-terminus domain -containing protein [Eastern grey kangaroopox virus]
MNEREFTDALGKVLRHVSGAEEAQLLRNEVSRLTLSDMSYVVERNVSTVLNDCNWLHDVEDYLYAREHHLALEAISKNLVDVKLTLAFIFGCYDCVNSRSMFSLLVEHVIARYRSIFAEAAVKIFSSSNMVELMTNCCFVTEKASCRVYDEIKSALILHAGIGARTLYEEYRLGSYADMYSSIGNVLQKTAGSVTVWTNVRKNMLIELAKVDSLFHRRGIYLLYRRGEKMISLVQEAVRYRVFTRTMNTYVRWMLRKHHTHATRLLSVSATFHDFLDSDVRMLMRESVGDPLVLNKVIVKYTLEGRITDELISNITYMIRELDYTVRSRFMHMLVAQIIKRVLSSSYSESVPPESHLLKKFCEFNENRVRCHRFLEPGYSTPRSLLISSNPCISGVVVDAHQLPEPIPMVAIPMEERPKMLTDLLLEVERSKPWRKLKSVPLLHFGFADLEYVPPGGIEPCHVLCNTAHYLVLKKLLEVGGELSTTALSALLGGHSNLIDRTVSRMERAGLVLMREGTLLANRDFVPRAGTLEMFTPRIIWRSVSNSDDEN